MNSLNINNLIQTVILRIRSYYFIVVFILILSSINIKAQQINQLEYFWNTDPGIGMASPITITPDSIIDITFQPSTTGLPQGLNSLYVRAKNDSLHWSFTQKRVMLILPSNGVVNASQLEYYIDTDPGFGFGTYVPIPNSDTVDISFNLNIQNLSKGLHTLFVRAKNTNGTWSFTQRHVFLVLGNLNTNIAKIEYYIDTDPGFDLGANVPFTVGDTVDVSFIPVLTGLSPGVHTLYVRAKDNNGLWTFTTSKSMLIYNNVIFPDITKLEYYFDINPGYGNGTNIAISPDDSIDIVTPISLSGLTVGSHKLHVRGKDSNDNWSHIHQKDVNVTITDNLYPTIAVTPALKTLTAVNCVTSVIDSFTVTNTGSNPLNVNIGETAAWMSVSPNAMGVPAGQSRTLYVLGTPSPDLSAQSSANITITTNDPVNPTVTRPVVFNVPASAYTMEISSDSLMIDTVQVNNTASGVVILTNTSCSSLEIDTILHSNPKFSHSVVSSSVSTSLAGYTYLGYYNGHSYFKSNGTSTWLVAESSVATLMGQLGLTGYMVSLNSSAENAWLLPLTNEINLFMGLRDADGTGNNYPCESSTSSNSLINCWKWSDGTSVLSNNYYNWISGEPNNSANEDFGHYVGSGHATLAGQWNDVGTSSSFKHILEVVGGFPSGATKEVSVHFESSDIGTFQDTMIIITQAGSDTIYLSATALGVPVIDLQNDSLQLNYTGCAIDTSLTTKIYNNGNGPLNLSVLTSNLPKWMNVVPDSNFVMVGDSVEVEINITNPTKVPGNFVYNIMFQSNDTITPIDTIKLHINIPGDSSLTMQYLTVNFDTIPRNTSTTFTSNLINNGCTPVYVSATSFATNVFEEYVSTIYLPPYSTYPMVMKFQPPLSGDFYDTLTINSNVGVQKFPVFGHAVGALTYELSKLASNVNVQDCNGMTMDTIKLYNVGDGSGTWSLATISQIPSWLMVNPQSGVLMAGDSIAIAIGYDATGLINNTYNHTLRINLSDPETSYTDIPSGMYVVGSTLMSFSQDTVDFGLTYFTTMETDTITIFNAGCDTFFVTNVLRDPQFGIDQTNFTVLPDSSKQIIVSITPVSMGMYADTMRFISINDTLYLPIFGQGVQYPQLIKSVKDSIVITMPAPIDVTTLNTNTWVIWGEHTGKQTGTYSLSGNDILFIPTQNFFAGEEVSYTLTQNVKFASGENIQPFSDSKNVKVWHATQGEFVIRPTDKVFTGNPGECYLNDINADGKIDFLFKTSASTVGVILRQNDNTLSNIITTTHPPDINTLEQIKDFNGDGFNDLVYSSGGAVTGKLAVLLNNGLGQFTNGPTLNTGYGARSLLLDFDLDGLYDVISFPRALLGSFGPKLETYRNLGNGSFQLLQSNYIQNNVSGFQIADLNRNGYYDIVGIGIRPASTISLNYLNYFNNKNGILQENFATVDPTLSIASKYNYNLSGNLGSDPILKQQNDLGIVNNNSTMLPSFSITSFYNQNVNVIMGDIDGDGRIDILPIENYIKAFKNISDNNFQTLNYGYKAGQVFSQNMADIDNDGDVDFAYIDAQGKLWIAYNEDNTADMSLSQYAIVDTFACADSITVPIKIYNTGTSPLVWQQDAATVAPAGPGGYAVVTGAPWLTSSSQYSEIPAGDSLILNLKINSKNLNAGTYNFNYIINSNDSENYKDTVTISFVVQTDSTITINPLSWDFGLVDTAQVYTKNIVITNTSCQAITLSGAFEQSGIYTASGLTSSSIPGFGSKTITVSLNPNALTVYEDTLVLTHSYGVQSIHLMAQGCNISPITHLYEQVCLASEVSIDSILYQNVSGCDSLVVTHYQLPNIVSTEGLVAYYPFNGNANDESGNGLNPNYVGTVLTTDRFDNLNSAYYFAGSVTNYISIPHNNLLNLNNSYSISLWVNSENLSLPTNHIISKGRDVEIGSYNIQKWSSYVRNQNGNYYGVQGNGSVSDGSWRNLIINVDSNLDSIYMFVDGVLVSKNYFPDFNSNNLWPLVIGRHFTCSNGGCGAEYQYKGKVDDIRIYNRSLTLAEIYNISSEGNATSTTKLFTQSCDTTLIGLDTTILTGANQYGCDSTIITQTSLQLPISNEGLVAYYPFDGNANDGSGLGNNGTVNGATLTTDRYGNANKAYSFDGNDWSESNSSLTNPTNQLTLSAWVRTSSSHTNAGIAGRWNDFNGASGSGREEFVLHASATGMNFSIKSGTQYNVGESSPVYNNNQWHHYVGVYNGTNIRLFRDGVLVNTVAASGNINTFAQNFEIGRYGGGVSPVTYFNGKIEDVQLYNRALTNLEIQAIYLSQSYLNTCIPGDVGLDTLSLTNICGQDSLVQQITSLQTSVSSEKLQAYYPFTGNANDMSGWGNHGMVNGATLASDRFGNPNGAYSFDGNDDNIQITNPPRSYNKELTVSWWVNASDFKAGGIGQGTANVDNMSTNVWLMHGNNTTMSWYVNDNGTWRYTSASMPITNGWVHIVGTASADSIRLYMNGVKTLTGAGISNQILYNPNSVIQLGKDVRFSTSNRHMVGLIDEVQVFARALSHVEIQAIYTNSNTNYTFNYFQSCDTSAIGIDTTIYPGAAQNGCDSLAINHISQTLPISNEGLQAYYNFDGNANDRSGNGRHGVLSGAILTTDQYGNANASYSFDGVDDRIDSLNIPLNGSSDWTIATWLKTGSITTATTDFQPILSSMEDNFHVGYYTSNHRLSIFDETEKLTKTNSINANETVYLVFRKSGNTLQIYKNDTLLVQNNNAGNLTISSIKRMGVWNPAGATTQLRRPFSGTIYDGWVYQRALSAAEMKQLYLLNKSADSVIVTKDSSLTFEPTMTGLSASVTTHISNTTCDTIYLDSIFTTNTVFTTNLNIPYLLPYQSKEFNVTFSPYAAIPFAGQLIIRNNNIDTVTITLNGNGCDLCACPTEDVVLNTQTQLNDFVAQYGGCDTIPVNMSILGDTSLTNMAGLQFIKRIEGDLHIINSQAITSMTGWQNLAGLAGELRLENNSELVYVDSLVALTAIGGQLSIKNNIAITSLNGLQNLLSVAGNLSITNNAALINCSAICNLINASSPFGITGQRTITGNPSECSSLNEVNIRCAPSCITGNIILTTQAEVNAFVAKGNMLSCNTLVGNLTISGANINSLVGMTFLKNITGNLTIHNNAILPTINGLDSLRKVGNILSITGNGALTHIDELLRLDTIGLDLTIQNNAALTQVAGLVQVDRVGRNLNVSSNSSLGDCDGLCYLMQTPSAVVGSKTVTNNPSPCSSITEVRIKCNENDCPDEDYILTTQMEVNTFIASFNDCDSIIGNLTIEGGNSINNISGLSFITYIGGSLTIRNNNLLTTLAGFNNLQKVNWALRIENNGALTNMTQLKRLKHISNELRLVNNDAMIVLTGLDSIQYIGTNLSITQNNVLVDASQLCRIIDEEVVAGTYFISNNPSPVSSVNEVAAICIYGSLVSEVLIQNLQDTIEEGSLLTFTVALDYPPNDTVTVSLVSSNQTEVPLPATVKILPGTISSQVSLLLPNNNVPEKDKSVTITGGAPYLTSATGQLVLTDHDDVPPIELIITQSEVSEGAGLYATSAKVRRLGALGNILNVTLKSDFPSQVILPTGVNLLANETEKTFFIGVLDNVLADGNRVNLITATVIINSCVCPAPMGTNGVSSGTFTILDNDGPTLTLTINPLSMPEGKINAGTLTITRNTPTNVALTVSLVSSDTTEIILPATATIPINATSVNIPVMTKSDIQEDGNQEVTITASHSGFTNGVIWAIVTDINKPDLVIPSAEALEDTIALEEVLPFKVYIHNKGLTASTRGISLIGYLSSDASISGDDHVIGQYFLDISIPAGDTIVYGGIGSIPIRIGNFNLLFKINPNESITELLYLNNTSPDVPVTIVPNYSGTAIVDSTVFLIGAPIVIYGSSYNSQGAKIGNVNLDIYLIKDGIRRTIAIKTNAQGDYSYTFNPLQSDFGHFIVGACYPGFNITDQQDAFDILGLSINNGNFLTWDILLGDTISSGIALRNVTNIPMTNVTMTPLSLPNGCSLVFNTIANFPVNTTLSVGYQIVAGAVTAPGVYQQFPIAVKSNTTTLQQVTGYYHCKAAQGLIVSSVANIVQNINKDQSKIVEFTITNRGQGSTGTISVAVPSANWVRLMSPVSIAALAPNQSATITVEFIPTSELPLNTPATGNIAINASSANGVSVPFTITKVSDVTGSILIDVINQFTYFTPEAPHLEGARVRISNYFTGQVYADGLSNTSGIFNTGNLPEGQLRIVVDAERHKSHDGVINIAPGSNGTKVIFLEYKAISFSWDVQPTTIEDEYEIDLIMNFEANVPVPVIVMSMADTLPRLSGSETFSFYINMTNKGLITAKEVKLDLPIDPEYELLTTYQPQDILAKQTIQVPVLMKRRVASGNMNGGNGSQNRNKVNDDVMKKAEQRLNFKKN